MHGNELYCDVARTVKHVCARDPALSAISVDVCDTKHLLAVFRDHGSAIRVFHFESCTNPSGKMMDFAVLPRLAALAPNCTMVCDNTWTTAGLFNPFEHGADLVVESCTKYISAGR